MDRKFFRDYGDHRVRLKYGRARIHVIGVLNRRSVQALRDPDLRRIGKFACGVAKGSHHGSDDVFYAFLQAMRSGATVISSGDGDGHGHPRPAVVAASATTGYREIDNASDLQVTSLVYATEMERSTRVGALEQVEEFNDPHDGDTIGVRRYGKEFDALPPEMRADARSQTSVFSRIPDFRLSVLGARAARGG